MHRTVPCWHHLRVTRERTSLQSFRKPELIPSLLETLKAITPGPLTFIFSGQKTRQTQSQSPTAAISTELSPTRLCIQLTRSAGTSSDPIYIRLKTNWSYNGQVKLYAPNGTLLASPSGYQGTELYPILPETGTYTLLVGDLEGDNTGSYDLYLQWTQDPANPIPITYGDYINGTITHPALYSTYTFNGTSSDPIYIRLKTNWSYSGHVKLYAPNGTLLASPSGYQGTDLSPILPVTGTYTLLVGDLEGDNTGSYDLYLQRTKDPANPIPITYGRYINGTITHPALYSTYTFNGTS